MKYKISAWLLTLALLISSAWPLVTLATSERMESLEDVIAAVEAADESDYTPEIWELLQENYDTATRLTGTQQYFAIRADVPNEPAVLWDSGWPSGHNNYNKYISVFDEPSSQVYLAYKGHGSNDYEKSEFSSDQLWEKVVVDEEKGIFMLRNLARDAYLCGTRNGNTVDDNAHQFFYVLKLDEIQDISRAQFTVGTDKIMRLQYESPSGEVYVDFYHSNDTVRSAGVQGLFTFPTLALADPRASTPYCAFEEVDMTNIEVDTEREEQKIIQGTETLLQLKLSGRFKSLYQEYKSALGDLEKHYEDINDYVTLTRNLEQANALLSGNLVRILHDSSDTVLTPGVEQKIYLGNYNKNNLAQAWYKMDGGEGYFQLINASSKYMVYQSGEQVADMASLVDYGHYLKTGDLDALAEYQEDTLFKVGTLNNLQPKKMLSETVHTISTAFQAPNGVAFTTAGADQNRAVILMQADATAYLSEAEELLDNIRGIRKRRLSSMDSTVSDLKSLLKDIDHMSQELYTDTSWSNLMVSYKTATELARKTGVTTAELNLMVYELEQKVADLKLRNETITAGNVAYTEALETLQPMYQTFTLKKYTEFTADRARMALKSAIAVAEKGIAGTHLVTYQELDELLKEANYAYTYLVDESSYELLCEAVTSITNRTDTPVDYIIRLDGERFQPITWEALIAAYEKANQMLVAFDNNEWETTSADVKSVATALNTAIAGLVTKPDYSALSAMVEMLDSLTIDETIFTEDSWSTYYTVYRVSKELIGDENTDQLAIDALTNELITAANSLKIDGVEGEVSLLPGVTVNINTDVVDRYDEGYDEGYLGGTSESYATGYTDGAGAAQYDFFNPLTQEQEEQEEEKLEIVEEVTSIVESTKTKNVLLEDQIRLYIPGYVIAIMAGIAIAIILGSFFGGFFITRLVIKKKQQKALPQESESKGGENDGE